jgi:N-formylglutamate amidohydrolase
MAPLSYTLVEPKGALSPLLVDSPHSGRIYPADFAYVCPLPLLRQAEDAYMDEVISGAVEAGATIMMAEFPRTMIDVNRAENDIDPTVIEGIWPEPLAPKSSTSTSFGLIRHRLRSGIPLYRAPLSVKEIQYRIDHYYRPYHDCLKEQIDRRIKNFGVCYFINAHSMPYYLDKELPMPDFVLGDRDGTSCDRSFTRRAQSILQDMGYHVVLNEPYKGREIVQRYGLEGQGAQALQIEVRRGLYMDEIAIEKHSGFLSLQRNMTRFFTYLIASIQNDASDRLAAE